MAIALDPGRLAAFNPRQREIIEMVNEWGYLDSGLYREPCLYRGRHMLDVGMGGGPHSVAFIFGGAASYTGVDPLVGTTNVTDFRALTDHSVPRYKAFPVAVNEIMAAFPNIRLFSGYMEDFVAELRSTAIDFVALSTVSEHLEAPDKVIKAAYDVAGDDAALWLSHGNYFSWSGHHLDPRTLEEWVRDDPNHNANVDWAHLDPAHPAYTNTNLNRIRLADLRSVVDKYFEIVQWREHLEYADRLTPERRQKWKKYTLSELLARMVYIYARKRPTPLATDLSRLCLFHPDEGYLNGEDHSDESDDHVRSSSLMFFERTRMLGCHSYNNNAGIRLLSSLSPGDAITLQKYDHIVTLTIEEVFKEETYSCARFVEEIPAAFYDEYPFEWSVVSVARGPAMHHVRVPDAALAVTTSSSAPSNSVDMPLPTSTEFGTG